MVSVENQPTTRTLVFSLGEGHLLPMPTLGAILRCVSRVYSDKLSTSVSSFVGKKCCKLSPGSIRDALGKAVVVNHTVDIQVFNSYDAEAINNTPAILVGKVRPSVRNTLVDMCNYLPPFTSGRSAFCFFGQSSLCLRQRLIIFSKEARVSNSLSSGQGSKAFQSDIDAHSFTRFWERLGFHFTSKGYKPLASACEPNTTGFDIALNRAMDDCLHCADLGQSDTIGIDRISTLGIGKAIIPTCSTKTRIARLFARLYPSKESLETEIDSHCHILQHLTMNGCKGRAFLLQRSEGINLVIHGKRLFSFFPSGLSLLQKMIVKPAALIQSVLHSSALACRGIESVAKSYLMHKYIVAQFTKGDKSYRASLSVSPL